MFASNLYTERRNRLHKKITNGLVLILGNAEASMNYPDNTYHYRQDSSFLYFFGMDHPNLAGVMDIDNNKDYIFGNDVTIDDIIWMGPQPSIKERATKAGINNTATIAELFNLVEKAISQGRKIHILPPYRGDNKIMLGKLLGIQPEFIEKYVSHELVKAVVSLRSIKDQYEIDEIERACAIGYQMHTTAMRMCKPGIYEREIAGAIEGIALSGGGMLSFPVILSVHGETLHNHYHGNKMKAGELMLCDAGAESMMHYASDNTRTSPVSGKFTQQQKEIYETVLDALNTSMAQTKPGVTYQSIHRIAARTIISDLKQIGLLKGDVDDALEQGVHALFMPHGLGHMMGMDVHDMEDFGENNVGYDEETPRSTKFGMSGLRLGRTLQPGFVMTNEPGCYFIPAWIDQFKAEKKFMDFVNYDKLDAYRNFGGIRLEDDILVTEDSYRILGERIPVTVSEVEAIMAD